MSLPPASARMPRVPEAEGRAPPSRIAWQRTVLALAVAGMGVVDLLSALLSHPPARLVALQRLVPTEVLDSSRTFTLLAGALLLVTAWGLRRGKRRAYVTALFLCAVSVPVNLLKARASAAVSWSIRIRPKASQTRGLNQWRTCTNETTQPK